MEVASSVYRLGSTYVNWYVIESGGKLTVVDTGIPAYWAMLVNQAAALGLTVRDVEVVLLTHAHQDHLGFAEQARIQTDAPVRVHEADAALARGEISVKRERSILGYLWRPATLSLFLYFARTGVVSVPPVKEVSTFSDGEVLDVPGTPRVIHAPGHTAGSCALHLTDRDVLLTGDVLVTRNVLTGRLGPQIMPSAFNENSAQAMASLERLAGIRADVLLPGHGEPWRTGTEAALRLAREAGPS